MSYKIQSTPFFQRMLDTSKRNGQLRQLKEEYERIKDFNEKVIEMKMRQMRLKRLFKEIEDIKETNSKRRRLIAFNDKPKSNVSNEQRRIEKLMWAKQLGQHFSRCNGINEATSDTGTIVPSSSVRVGFLSKRQLQEREREKEKRTKARVDKRTNYGNQISNWNMQKMLMGKLRTEVSEGMKQTARKPAVEKNGPTQQKSSQITSETSLDGKEKLMNRIRYGNTISDLNMKLMPKAGRSHDQPNESKKDYNNPDSDETSTIVLTALSDISRSAGKQYQSCVEIPDYIMLDNGHLDKRQSQKALQTQDYPQDDLEYQLRCISNDTNLPQTAFIIDRCEQEEFSDSEEGGQLLRNETLVHTDCLYKPVPVYPPKEYGYLQAVSPPPPPEPLPVMVQPRLSLKTIPKSLNTYITSDEEIQNLIKKYEPYSMQVVQKEIKEFGVDKLLQIFEHQNA